MSYSNTYSNGFGYGQQSSSTSGTGSFSNQVRGQRKNSTYGWRNNLGSNSDRVETSGDVGFLRSTMGSFGTRPNKQLFQSAALQGERRKEVNLRHTTGNLADILRNLNFDKQLSEQQSIPKSNKYSTNNTKDLTNSSHNNSNTFSPIGQGFRKQKHTHSTLYESRPVTSYEPLEMRKQVSSPNNFVSNNTTSNTTTSNNNTTSSSSSNNTTTTRKFDIDEMFNKIKREKQLQEELRKLREEKRLREEREKERERQRQRQRQREKLFSKQSPSSSSSSSLSNLVAQQKFTNTFTSSSSTSSITNNKQSSNYYTTRPSTNYTPTYNGTVIDQINPSSSSTTDYQQKYSNFSKKQRYGAAYTPKRQYQFEKKTYQFEKKYDTAGKKQYDWKKSSQVVPSFLKDYKNDTTKVSAFQLQISSSSTTTNTYITSKTPNSKSPRPTSDTISKYFSSSKEKTQKFDCKVTIRDFRLGKQLGQGKFGTVYQAVHKPTNSLYALKKVPKSIIKSHYMIDQFILQLKLQSYMNNQYILTLHGFFHDAQHIYLILDYMQQGTLYTILKKNKKLQYQDAATKIKQIAKGIIYMHENGIAHRDIKPQNVVMSNGSCKLCDFGWSTICDERRKTYCGTFDYAAPEILQGAQYDMSVDLWCLGVMAYQLLVGKAPFYHIKKQQTKKRILNVQSQPISYPNDMPKDAVDFIQRLLKKDPQERIKNQQLLYHPFLAKV